MNLIEERIWDYIDGFCTSEEQEAIAQLIKTDSLYRDKYAELLEVQKSISLLDLEVPSMAFTNKVMDKVALQSKPLSSSVAIDKRIIYSISALLGFMLLISLAMMVKNIDWPTLLSNQKPSDINYHQFDNLFKVSATTKSLFLYSFFMFDTIAGLMILDKFLRKN